ncbi:hypothetical protein DY138_05885 [Apilactobacillus timberlakei]|uniref:SIMPL domain-containing protein n=1 Tax=Apilactobacillus timberlakei TaxID=2008380 RepID=UPI00112E1FE4|nr:SIMPL domain-containing protein [Apilactobacillus timberlakei]TPR18012.1 hypothetical protein DY138_05885 [Apilactobacillus timberlakei]TPR19814.1 hypothetical protein DY061_05790 [Apilactobacillus timberlakei]TPR21352.1 hypothetical protein DY083_06285 [Apilactobacillus timberlakei]
MQSSLKKSLYLGLAALSFASVASVTANASNANAAKKHHAAKKVTYKTTNKDLDQTVTFKATGKNAVYNKAVGKRSVVASKADMASKANSKDVKDLFMAYQEGVTSKGVHYYKVVSFDKKVRGFVYNKGVAKTNTTVAADKPSNTTGYLQNTNRFFNKAYGSQFKTSLKNDYKGMNIAADQFTVSDAVKVNNDQTYYYVTDKNNQLINGWVNSVYFSNNITDAAKNATNSANAIHVKYVDNANLGSVLMEKNINPANLSSTGTYSNTDVNNAISNSLIGTGFVNPSPVSTSVAKGGDVTVTVSKGATQYLSTNNFVPFSVSNVGNVDQSTDKNSDLSNKMSTLQLSSDQWKSLFQGNQNQTFNFNNFEASLLAPGKAWNQFTIGTKTYTYNANFTRDSNKVSLNDGTNGKRDMTYDEIAKGNFNIYYDVKDNANTSTNNGDMSNSQYQAQQRVNAAVNDFNNGNKQLSSVVTKDYSSAQAVLDDIAASKLNNSDVNALKDVAQAQATKDQAAKDQAANKQAAKDLISTLQSKVNDNTVKDVNIQNHGNNKLELHYTNVNNNTENKTSVDDITSGYKSSVLGEISSNASKAILDYMSHYNINQINVTGNTVKDLKGNTVDSNFNF